MQFMISDVYGINVIESLKKYASEGFNNLKKLDLIFYKCLGLCNQHVIDLKMVLRTFPKLEKTTLFISNCSVSEKQLEN